jgi:hypothetical protein
MLEPLAGPTALPCEGCPEQALSDYLGSPGGQLISAVVDLDYALQAGVAVRLDEIPYTAFVLLRQLSEERDKFQAEEIRKQNKT